MAQQSSFRGKWAIPIFSAQLLMLLQLVPTALASIESLEHRLNCYVLPTDLCAFAVDSSGRRCVLETVAPNQDWQICQTSPIIVGEDVPTEYIETDQCVKTCGASQMSVGLSTDPLMSFDTLKKLCSLDCSHSCPNIIDLYSSLAQGEGSSLEQICLDNSRQRLALDEESRTLPVNIDVLRLRP